MSSPSSLSSSESSDDILSNRLSLSSLVGGVRAGLVVESSGVTSGASTEGTTSGGASIMNVVVARVVVVSEGLWSCCHASLLRQGGRALIY